VKSKENTQKTFKTLENECKPRNTPVGAMEQANNTHRHANPKNNPKTQKKKQNNSRTSNSGQLAGLI